MESVKQKESISQRVKQYKIKKIGNDFLSDFRFQAINLMNLQPEETDIMNHS